MVTVLQSVSGAISKMHRSADTVSTAAASVEEAVVSLRGSVDDFLRKVAM